METMFLETKVYKGERFSQQSRLDIKTHFKATETLQTAVYLFLECFFFISGVEFFTVNNRKMHTFELLIVKGDTLRLLIVKCVSYD